MIAHLLAAVVAPFFFRRWGRTCFYGLAAVPALSFLWLAAQLPQVLNGTSPTQSLPWIPHLGISLSFRLDMLSWILSAMVLGVGALVLFYCASYFRHTNRYSGTFAAQLIAFAGVMFGLVTADDLMVMFVFWEITSVLSYLLVGYNNTRLSARRAALQALIVTTAGGLAMFIGLVMLALASGTWLLSEIIARAPQTIADPGYGVHPGTALTLILVGALAKSALFPLHFWLPGAMAAPTPVSAFLHAAAMVKAGIYLIARLAPAFAENIAPWVPVTATLGVFTLLFGGYAALRQTDLKLILAYGTVSQLGFITTVVALGTPDALYAGLALMIAHSLFKSVLFLITGIIDHQAGTRDIRRLNGIWRKTPTLFGLSLISAASMAGLPPLLGFVAKESVLETLLHGVATGHLGALGPGGAWMILSGLAAGSVLTVAYSARFIWGGFLAKDPEDAHPDTVVGGTVQPTEFHEVSPAFAAAPAVITALTLLLGLWPASVHTVVEHAAHAAGHPEVHLALWHGLTPALGLSVSIFCLGFALFAVRSAVDRAQAKVPAPPAADAVYRGIIGSIDYLAVRITSATQRGSLSFYLAVILATAVIVPAVGLIIAETPPLGLLVWNEIPGQWAVATVIIIAALVTMRATKRFLAILMVSITGYGAAVIFAMRGAPDLALTQLLVETISLVAYVLALRMLPAHLWESPRKPGKRSVRLSIAIGFSVLMMALAAFVLSSRTTSPISLALPHLAYEFGAGKNVVNVTLVDVRAWDTLGEIAVLALAATGVASLIFISGRQDHTAAESGLTTASMKRVRQHYQNRDDLTPGQQLAGEFMSPLKDPFIVAGRTLAPEHRSLMLEFATRMLFHIIVLVSVYLLLAGHNLPGGGFAGGLLAGLALTLRYLAGGRYELEEATPVNAGILLGTGLLIATLYAMLPLAWGGPVLASYDVHLHLPLLGEVHLVSSLIFDIGVYLIVIGLILDVLRSLGGKIDEQLEEERAEERRARRRRGRRITVRRAGGVLGSQVLPTGQLTHTTEQLPHPEDRPPRERETEGSGS